MKHHIALILSLILMAGCTAEWLLWETDAILVLPYHTQLV